MKGNSPPWPVQAIIVKGWIWKPIIAGLSGTIVHFVFMYLKSRIGLLPSFQPYHSFQTTLSAVIGTAKAIADARPRQNMPRREIISDFARKEASTVSVVVDPGTAYIAGYRVQTTRNTVIYIPKGIDTDYANTVISLAYGNYINVNNLSGPFLFSTGDTVKLYSTAKGFLNPALVATMTNAAGN